MTGYEKVVEAAARYGWSVEPIQRYQGKAVGKDIEVQNRNRRFDVLCKSNGAIIAVRGHRNILGQNKAEQIIDYMAKYPKESAA